MDMWEGSAKLINSIGFPIFVAIWMLIKGSNETRELTRAVQALEKAISNLIIQGGVKNG